MRAIEAMNIFELGRIHARPSTLRKESRLVPWHYQVDYLNLNRDDANCKRAIVVHSDCESMTHNV